MMLCVVPVADVVVRVVVRVVVVAVAVAVVVAVVVLVGGGVVVVAVVVVVVVLFLGGTLRHRWPPSLCNEGVPLEPIPEATHHGCTIPVCSTDECHLYPSPERRGPRPIQFLPTPPLSPRESPVMVTR